MSVDIQQTQITIPPIFQGVRPFTEDHQSILGLTQTPGFDNSFLSDPSIWQAFPCSMRLILKLLESHGYETVFEAETGEEGVRLAFALGAWAFIEKPALPDEFLEKVKAVIQQKRLKRNQPR